MSENQDDCGSCKDESCPAKGMKPGESPEQLVERQAINRRMCRIKHKVIVMSGKGGVGKTTVAVNLAVSLARERNMVGIMDADIHGPNVPKMTGANIHKIYATENSLIPVEVGPNLKVMSMALLLKKEDEAVIWRGPMKMGLIKQFLKDVEWGDLDYLIIDAPPGTGDEPLSVVQLIEDLDGAIIVTTPQDIALLDVRKSITFCKHLKIDVLGIVENMSGFVCPHCGEKSDIFKSGGGLKLANDERIRFLGAIPIDGDIVQHSDAGGTLVKARPKGTVAKSFTAIRENLENVLAARNKDRKKE
ncbi:MAG: Mrp/NBP35 family ATP-binding protein [Pseudomonadota bacterium]